jgi:hypothetical protein
MIKTYLTYLEYKNKYSIEFKYYIEDFKTDKQLEERRKELKPYYNKVRFFELGKEK